MASAPATTKGECGHFARTSTRATRTTDVDAAGAGNAGRMPALPGRRSTRRRAISLLEVLIAVALSAVLFTVYFVFTEQAMKSRDEAAARAEQTQIARQVLDRVAMELRGTLGMEQIGFPIQARLIGDRRSIKFLTTALPTPEQFRVYRESDDLPPGHHDLREIEYKLWVDGEKTTEAGDPLIGGIIRTEKQTLNQLIVDEEEPEQLRQDLWSHELGYLEFRYYDGAQWSTVWDITEGNSLPQLIMITVGFKPATQADLNDADLDQFPVDEFPFGDPTWRPDRFTQIVRIQAADRFFSSRFQRVGKQLSSQLGVEGVPQ